jgi:phospholipid N-methyltransferase
MRLPERPLHFLAALARNTLVYIKNFLRDRDVASVMPSSPFLVRRMLAKMDLGGRCVVVEYGPAAGVFSRSILRKMGPEGRLLLVETNADFVRRLREQFEGDPRVEIFHRPAQKVTQILNQTGEDHADYVLSGIPFSFLDAGEQHVLIEATRQAIRPGGTFLVYQHKSHMGALLPEHFASVERDFEPINLPPIHIHAARRVDD